jgi:hypothetical protein
VSKLVVDPEVPFPNYVNPDHAEYALQLLAYLKEGRYEIVMPILHSGRWAWEQVDTVSAEVEYSVLQARKVFSQMVPYVGRPFAYMWWAWYDIKLGTTWACGPAIFAYTMSEEEWMGQLDYKERKEYERSIASQRHRRDLRQKWEAKQR